MAGYKDTRAKYSDIKNEGIVVGTNEHKVLLGQAHVSGTKQALIGGNPLGQIYPFTQWNNYLATRVPVKRPIWKNMIRVFDSVVWLWLFISFLALGTMMAVTYYCYRVKQ